MKCYFDYEGIVPEGVQVVREGLITRIYFDHAVEERKIDEDEVQKSLVAENVDITGTVTKPVVISAIVRTRYSQSAVEAILANGGDTEEHAAELEAFKAWRIHAKEVAAQVLSKLNK